MTMIAALCAAVLTCTGADTADADPGQNANTARCAEVWSVNTIEVRPGMWDHARRYYEAVWLPSRKEALRQGLISDYRLLATQNRRDEGPQLLLITVYKDQAQFAEREANFRALFERLSLPRPITIDGMGRDDIIASTEGLDDYVENFGSGDCSGQ